MRATLGPIIAILLLAAAGMGVLATLGLVEYSLGAMIGAMGLAFLTGAAAIGTLLLALLTVGVPYGTGSVVVVGLLVAITGALMAFGPRREGSQGPHGLRTISRSPLAGLIVLLAAMFVAYAMVGFFRASVTPMNVWDGWALWTRKAMLLTDFHHLPTPFFTDRAYVATHQNYPLLLPLLESIWFRFGGEIDTQSLHIELWLLLVGFVWSAAYLLARRAAPILVWAPLLLALALASGISNQLLSGYADLPMALVAGLGILLIGFWISDREREHLVLATVFLAAAANVKNEGLPVAIIAVIAATVVVPGTRARRELGLALVAVLIAVAPWHIWSAIHGVPADADVPVSKIFNLGYMLGRTGRIWPGISALQVQLTHETSWLYVVPIGAGIALGCLIWRVARRPAVFYFATAIALFALYVVVYWVSPLDLTYYLGTTDNRVIDVIVFTALAAALQLPGEVQAALAAGRRSVADDLELVGKIRKRAAVVRAVDQQ